MSLSVIYVTSHFHLIELIIKLYCIHFIGLPVGSVVMSTDQEVSCSISGSAMGFYLVEKCFLVYMDLCFCVIQWLRCVLCFLWSRHLLSADHRLVEALQLLLYSYVCSRVTCITTGRWFGYSY